ncbi:hypothetical protein EKL30_00285 [Candidimonas sp. SYP-B2681]|uniref:hypothetical protein n=1 Tax=Candidimonas sp. SYP-B2681 TaxID=2497686 RepID=UPI000F885C3B|nr:hypothetical protein [Candidimonas sp. SYP-B2681]RTZ47488.1 hypothetical protein EKL30_00285 [Candidimonas sp. SYP-B2681]
MHNRQSYLSTEALAELLCIRPGTLREALCRRGHYYGVRPVKLASGRLVWPTDSFERLTTGKER